MSQAPAIDFADAIFRRPTHEDPTPTDDYVPTDDDAPDAPPEGSAPTQQSKDPKPLGRSVSDVIDQWRSEGPLIHEPTGIASLDEATGGGFVYGSRVTIVGAPNGGKTGLCLQISETMAKRGVAVGFLAVDEEPGDVVTRLVQRAGWRRKDAERRFPTELERMREALGDLPIRFYGEGACIERAAEELARFAAERAKADPGAYPHGPRAILVADSVQTIKCAAEVAAEREMSVRDAVAARVRALRSVASRHRLIAVSTSEMNRSAYRSRDAAESSNDMAAGAETRAIEYQARVLLAVRSVAGEKDLVELKIVKNKQGTDGEAIYLRLDRASQTFTATNYTPEPSSSAPDRRVEAVRDAVTVARILRGNPGVGVRQLRALVRAESGAGVSRIEAAIALLGPAVVRGAGPRGSVPLELDVPSVPECVRHGLEVDDATV